MSSDAGIVSLGVNAGPFETRFDSSGQIALRLEAGDWVSFDPASGTSDRGRREPAQIGSWRGNLIIADREPSRPWSRGSDAGFPAES
jgi:transmembrane sensor